MPEECSYICHANQSQGTTKARCTVLAVALQLAKMPYWKLIPIYIYYHRCDIYCTCIHVQRNILHKTTLYKSPAISVIFFLCVCIVCLMNIESIYVHIQVGILMYSHTYSSIHPYVHTYIHSSRYEHLLYVSRGLMGGRKNPEPSSV